MSTLTLSSRQAWRLARSGVERSLVVAGTVAAATTVGIVAPGLAAGSAAIAVAVVVVARRSLRPERAESDLVWRRLGAKRSTIWASGALEALLLGWTGAFVGGALGILLRSALGLDARDEPVSTFAVSLLVLITLAAAVPTTRLRSRRRAHTEVFDAAKLVARVVGAVLLLLVAYNAATVVDTDFELAFAGIAVIGAVSFVASILSGIATRRLPLPLSRARVLAPAGTIAGRHRAPLAVRLVIATAVTVAVAAAVLGASVEARADTRGIVAERLARLPVLPANTALVRLESNLSTLAANPSGAEAELPTEFRRALARVAPGTEVVELRQIGSSSFIFEAFSRRFVVEEPRLRQIYGSDATYGTDEYVSIDSGRNLPAATRVPTTDDLARRVNEGRPFPLTSFTDATYYEVPRDALRGSGEETYVRGAFVRAPRPFTPAQLQDLTALVRRVPAPAGTTLTLIGPRGALVNGSGASEPPARSTLREAPWAATTAGGRWSAALAAIAFSLVALLVTLAIDTYDRRRDVRRLERLGATPGHVRAGAALHAGLLLAAVAWFDLAVLTWFVHDGTREFSARNPAIPVPFVFPWAVAAAIAIGLPLLGAACAALLARPRTSPTPGM